MTIEVQNPELEAFLRERMESGEFASAEDALLKALHLLDFSRNRLFEQPSSQLSEQLAPPANDLDAMFAEIRGLADDLDFSRIPSTERPVDL